MYFYNLCISTSQPAGGFGGLHQLRHSAADSPAHGRWANALLLRYRAHRFAVPVIFNYITFLPFGQFIFYQIFKIFRVSRDAAARKQTHEAPRSLASRLGLSGGGAASLSIWSAAARSSRLSQSSTSMRNSSCSSSCGSGPLLYPRTQLLYLSGDVLLVAPVLLGQPKQVGADLRAGRGEGLNVCNFCIFLFSHGIFLSFGAKRRHFAAQAAVRASASS